MRERQVGFVFQHYALFRHMTVFENVAFGLRVKPRKERPAEAEIRKRVTELLDLVQLGWLADRYPSQLSGGSASGSPWHAPWPWSRAFCFWMNRSRAGRQGAQGAAPWLRRLHDELHITSIFVTHDQDEALEVADRVVLMNKGRVSRKAHGRALRRACEFGRVQLPRHRQSLRGAGRRATPARRRWQPGDRGRA